MSQTLDDLSTLYEADETAWLDAMVNLIERGQLAELDYGNLSEYLADRARSDRREVKSRLATLMAYLLKWTYQPEQRTRSWQATIAEQRQELEGLVASGVLRQHAERVLDDAYAHAIERAAVETGRAQEAFPSECPYSVHELLSRDLLSQ